MGRNKVKRKLKKKKELKEKIESSQVLKDIKNRNKNKLFKAPLYI